jgi:hypothetical protein
VDLQGRGRAETVRGVRQPQPTNKGHNVSKGELIKLPARFFDDHEERELPTPHVVRRSARFVWINADDAALKDLVEDARWYASDDVDLELDSLWARRAARTLLASLTRNAEGVS